MQPLPISPLEREDVFVSGDVTIHANAAIAPGVVLQAGPNERIIIADGVCLGLGVVIHAHQGNICVKAGANLGAGVLIVGACTVGPYASIGAASTIINQDIAPDDVVPAGTVLGDRSRPQEAVPPEVSNPAPPQSEMPSPWDAESSETSVHQEDQQPTPPQADSGTPPETSAPDPSGPPESPPDSQEAESPNPDPAIPNVEEAVESEPAVVKRLIYGQVHLNQMLTTLFPHAHHLKSPSNPNPAHPSESS
ncbi:hypothetical protein NEA10_07305 [Phormidium yuhuli AB48]|uniref:Carbon dioxide concentrating mechanism protein n=1 Tax=Phormidium yuhuli AB48 TaxID=2940671 RepID=A0ABY5AUG8_9CYAN|nr:hypothetical protein [Phormidium yuhuli]USR92515.1 hypothetical protein NEA10_07305 [Phormidium yuhuli AB48]